MKRVYKCSECGSRRCSRVRQVCEVCKDRNALDAFKALQLEYQSLPYGSPERDVIFDRMAAMVGSEVSTKAALELGWQQ